MDARAPIVVGYDGSPDACLALDWAAHTAVARHCPLRVIVVVTDLDYVVGSDRAELLLGSVSQHVLHAARCPVAVVR